MKFSVGFGLHTRIRNHSLSKRRRSQNMQKETSSLNPQDANLIGVSVSFAENEAYYIPLDHKNVKSLNNFKNNY